MRARGVGALAAAALVLAVVAGCGGGATSPPTAGDAVRVVATTTVFADLVAQVGGEAVEVRSLVPKGGEVHTFDPTPSDLRAVADADLVVMNGLGLDDWLRVVVEDSGATASVLELAPDLPGVTYLDDGGAVNPHLWLDVSHAARYVERIIEALVIADPTQAADLRAGGEAYLARLAGLDEHARTAIGSIPEERRIIVSFHEAFPYFAAAYGLVVAGTIIDAPGQDPSAGEIATLVEEIKASGARAIFSEAQFSPELVQTVADEAGVVVETNLYNDSLGDAPADTYEGMMRWNIERVVGALGG